MIRIFATFAFALLLGSPIAASAHETSHGMMSHEMLHGTTATVTGEVVDTGCYLGHAAKGEAHTSCALKCVKGGMPMALLTPQGALYLVTMNHDNPDPYNRLKELAGKKVTVTGTLLTRNGMKGIDVTTVKPAA